MDEPRHITDPNGKLRPMLDQQGNLNAEVLRLYANSLLNADDTSAVERALADDPFASEAMEGFKGLSAEKLNAHLNGIGQAVAEKLGTQPVTVIEEDRPFMRLAAAFLVLLGLGGATYYALQFLPTDKIVALTQQNETPPAAPAERPAPPMPETVRPNRPSFDVSGQPMTPHEQAQTTDNDVDESEPATGEALTNTDPANKPESTLVSAKTALADTKPTETTKPTATKAAQNNPVAEPAAALALAPEAAPVPITDQKAQTDALAQRATTRSDDVAKRKEGEVESRKKKNEDKSNESARTAAPKQQAKAEIAAAPPMSEEERGRLPLFNQVEQPPKFPGGDLEMYRYIENNRGFQNSSETNSGNVYISFVIDEQGRVRSPEVSRGISPELDADALRLISKMPRWEPAQDGGKPAAVRKTVMVKYR